VVWRAHLPLLPHPADGQKQPLTAISDFFAAASIHLREQLETETYRVEKWVIERAKNLLKRAEGQITKQKIKNEQSGNGLVPGQIIALILDGAGDCTATLTLAQLANLKERRSGVTLANHSLVVHRDFAGLSAAGTLDHKWDDPPAWLADSSATVDDGDLGEDAPTTPWRVVPWSGEPPPAPGAHWHLRQQFALSRNADGEISAGLAVFEWRNAVLTEQSRSLAAREQGLAEHQTWAAERAHAIATALGLPSRWVQMLTIAARLHDEGKQIERWQRAFNAPREGGPYAKTRGPINQQLLDGYRHELGSLFFAEQDAEFQSLAAEDQDLVLHLIAAHHGNARPLIETRGCDLAPPSRLEARQREIARRFAALQRRWGPWGLAWWEALVRAADQQASKDNEQRGS
jgi:CRISPR-associated endonuclease/helicase Cas3